MNKEQLEKMKSGKGFIAALDQSGGSTPKALVAYGIDADQYQDEGQMFDKVHEMRTRIIASSAFSGDHILGAILFKETMNRQINGKDTADYLWEEKNIVPFLKVDQGLADENDGVQLMKPLTELDSLLANATEKHIFGTKMRSVIKKNNSAGIKAIVDQQFEVGLKIYEAGLIPIIEPEVDIHAEDKSSIEATLKSELLSGLEKLPTDTQVMFKLTLPDEVNLYQDFVEHPNVLRVVALSGGYSRDEANEKLAQNAGVVASFSRALAQDLRAGQSDEEFDKHLAESVMSIYRASRT